MAPFVCAYASNSSTHPSSDRMLESTTAGGPFALMADFSAHRGNDSETWKESIWAESSLNAQEEILPVEEFKLGSWSKVWEQWSERMIDQH